MKNLFSALIMLLICGMIVVPMAFAAGTDYNTTITNRASIQGLNFLTSTTTNRTNVRAIVGATWSAQSDDQGSNPGSYQTNITTLSNFGNGIIAYQLSVDSFASLGNGVADWPWQIITNSVTYLSGSGNAGPGPSISLAEGAAKTITFRVLVNPGATAATQQFRLIAQSPTGHINTDAYVGDNGTTYGASWGAVVADRVVIAGTGAAIDANDNLYSITTAASPLITISKSILSISDVSGYGSGVAIPGAKITYQIKVTNAAGSGPASGVVVKDLCTSGFLATIADQAVGGASTEAAWAMSVVGTTLTWSNTQALFEAGNRAYLTFTAIIQ
jgi:uncharacterized repeat protein (TIGR01451 family)